MVGIIPAAGKGTRFKDLGKTYNKSVLPYKEKPLIIHQIEWLRKQGCDNIIVILNHKKETVLKVLEMYNITNIKIKEQKKLTGLSSSIYEAKDVNDEILILLGDVLPISDKLDYSDNFLGIQKVNDYSRWCLIDKDGNFYDKPDKKPPTNLALSGIYFIKNSKKLFEYIKEQIDKNIKINNEYQLSTALSEYFKNETLKLIEIPLLDFGTIDDFLKNKSVKNSREFNEIKDNGLSIIKKSNNQKIINEINWFMNLPHELKLYTPRILQYDLYGDKIWYEMEKIYMPTLRELFLFIDTSSEIWETIFNNLFALLDKKEMYKKENEFYNYIIEKTEKRIKDINIEINNKIVFDFLNQFKTISKKFKNKRNCVMHGDFCFSNILYDISMNNIKLIDPRGDIFGNTYYEVAKLMHSVLFDYDFIDAELYIKTNDDNVKIYNDGVENIKKIFLDKLNEIFTNDEILYIYYICASLFLSMIPLHNHNKTNQKLFYKKFKEILNIIHSY